MVTIEVEYIQLKDSLSRHPGAESSDQFEICKQTLEEEETKSDDGHRARTLHYTFLRKKSTDTK